MWYRGMNMFKRCMLTLLFVLILSSCEEDFVNSYPPGYMLTIDASQALMLEKDDTTRLTVQAVDDVNVPVFQSKDIEGQIYPYCDEYETKQEIGYIASFRKGLERKIMVRVYKNKRLVFEDTLTVKTEEDYKSQDYLIKTEVLKFENMDNVVVDKNKRKVRINKFVKIVKK